MRYSHAEALARGSQPSNIALWHRRSKTPPEPRILLGKLSGPRRTLTTLAVLAFFSSAVTSAAPDSAMQVESNGSPRLEARTTAMSPTPRDDPAAPHGHATPASASPRIAAHVDQSCTLDGVDPPRLYQRLKAVVNSRQNDDDRYLACLDRIGLPLIANGLEVYFQGHLTASRKVSSFDLKPWIRCATDWHRYGDYDPLQDRLTFHQRAFDRRGMLSTAARDRGIECRRQGYECEEKEQPDCPQLVACEEAMDSDFGPGTAETYRSLSTYSVHDTRAHKYYPDYGDTFFHMALLSLAVLTPETVYDLVGCCGEHKNEWHCDRAEAYATDFYDADKVFLLIGLNAPRFHRLFSVVVEHNELDAARDLFRDISFVAEECKRRRCEKEDFAREVAARFSKACASGLKHSFCTDDGSNGYFSFDYWMTFGTAFGLEGAPTCRPRTFGSFATSIGPRVEHGMCVDDGVAVQHQAEVPASEYDAEDCARTVGRLTREWRHAGGEGPGYDHHEAHEDMEYHWSVIFDDSW